MPFNYWNTFLYITLPYTGKELCVRRWPVHQIIDFTRPKISSHNTLFMRILEISVMRGPNYWSTSKHKLIVLKLDIEEMEERPTNEIKGFADRLEAMFPSLYHHRCSEGVAGGLFKRVREGTWMGHVVEHIALEIQTLAGMDCGFGRTRSTGEKGIYNVFFSYQEEKVGRYAAYAAVDIAQALADGRPYDLEADLKKMRKIRDREALGPSTAAIVEEAQRREIPVTRFGQGSRVMLGYGINQKHVQATIASTTGNLAVEIACDKEETKRLLEAAAIPVPNGVIVYDEDDVYDAIDELGFPLVIKPVNGNHGRGATINIKTEEQAIDAFGIAQKISEGVIVERYVQGDDYRLLVINHKLVAAAKRTPAAVTGDGVSSIRELIDKENADPRRGDGHDNVLTKIEVDAITEKILEEKRLTMKSVLRKDEVLHLKKTANLSTGGTATDVTDIVHPYNVFLAERVSRIIGLDICGIDIIAPDLTEPLNKNGGAVLEVNAAPGFRMHIAPSEGLSRNVAEPVIDMLYPEGTSSTIPIVAITGTNGKTTTTRLIAHIAKTAGHKVGYTTTDGIYVQGKLVREGDCAGPASAEFVLRDPTVDFAVLECARGGILKSGLGFPQCDIGIVTNVAEDHLGLKDINSVEDMAKVKSVVPESVHVGGYAVLNADDDLVYEMAKRVKSNVAFFSLNPSNPRLAGLCESGEMTAVVENGYITVCKGSWKVRVEKVQNIPLAFGGSAEFMVQNILAAVLVGFIRNFKLEDIRLALKTFIPSPKLTPGRLNVFKFRNFQAMVDYAHNPAGMEALARFVTKVDSPHKVGVIAGVGDRRDSDIKKIGTLAAGMFDEIIVRNDDDLRGRTIEEINTLVMAGIREANADIPVTVIPDSAEAIIYALKNAKKNSFITICTEKIQKAIDLVSGYNEGPETGSMPGPGEKPQKAKVAEPAAKESAPKAKARVRAKA
jgi:cyanophycin synthetase